MCWVIYYFQPPLPDRLFQARYAFRTFFSHVLPFPFPASQVRACHVAAANSTSIENQAAAILELSFGIVSLLRRTNPPPPPAGTEKKASNKKLDPEGLVIAEVLEAMDIDSDARQGLAVLVRVSIECSADELFVAKLLFS